MHILVAVDRSEESHNALVNALDIVDSFDGTVTAVHAVTPEDNPTETDTLSDSTDKEEAEDVLEEAVERASKRGISIETEILVGNPIAAIAEYAEENDVDVIYVGHRGLSNDGREFSGESRGALGSVSKGLVEQTHVPVTIFDRGI